MNIFGEVATTEGDDLTVRGNLQVGGDLTVGGNLEADCIDAQQYKEKGIDSLLVRTDANLNLACGDQAGVNQSACAIALGVSAGSSSQGLSCIAIGEVSGENNQTFGAVAVGVEAGRQDQGQSAIAIGRKAGLQTQGNYSVCIGESAGENFTRSETVCIGRGTVGESSVAVALGRSAKVQSNCQGSIAIGSGTTITAGTSFNDGENNVAIGRDIIVPANVKNSISLGTGITDTESDECVLGGNSLKRVRPSSDDLCDLATETKRFKHAYLSSGVTVKSLSNVGAGQQARITFDGQINRAAGLQWTTFDSFDDWRIGRPYNGGADANNLLTVSHESTSADDPARTNYIACDSTAGTVDLLSNTFRSDKTLNGYTIGGGLYRQEKNPLVNIDSIVATSIFNNGGITFTPEQMVSGATYQVTAIGVLQQDEGKANPDIFVDATLGASSLVLHSMPISKVTGTGSYTFDFTLNFAKSDVLSDVWSSVRLEMDLNEAKEDDTEVATYRKFSGLATLNTNKLFDIKLRWTDTPSNQLMAINSLWVRKIY